MDAIAITVDGPKAWDLDLALDVTFSDLGRSFRLTLRNGVLISVEKAPSGDAPLHLTLAKSRLLTLLAGDEASEGITVEGDIGVLRQLVGVLQPGDPAFEIVLP